MKIHRPLWLACENALIAIFCEGAHAGVVVEKNLKTQKKWGARDRRFFSETVYEVVRWWRRLLALAGMGSQFHAVEPVHVARVLEVYISLRERPEEWGARIDALTFVEREALSNELDHWGREQIGTSWEALIAKMNMPARQYLRVNTLKLSRLTAQEQLSAEGIATDVVEGFPHALVLRERKNVFTSQTFKAGGFEMQDIGSQLIAPFLQLEPGLRFVDACAGAGGKSLHAAALMRNKGQIIALDVQAWKLKELQLRARRAGVSLLDVRPIESTKTIKRLYDSADRLLLDVPCTGSGVIRRHPDTKWKFNLRELARTLKTQAEILLKYSPIVKAGGMMVYATCSVAPAENEQQVHKFLAQADGAFVLEEELHLSPLDYDGDGFYAARLRRVK